MPDLVCTPQRFFASCLALEVYRWITSLAGGTSSRQLKVGRTGPTAESTPLASNCVKMVSKRLSKLKSSVSDRRSAANNDDRREDVRRGIEWGIDSAMKFSCPSYFGDS